MVIHMLSDVPIIVIFMNWICRNRRTSLRRKDLTGPIARFYNF